MASTRTALFSRNQRGGVFTVDDVADHPGDIFFVDSTNSAASDSATFGNNPIDRPLATIDYAIGLCTASKGDVIYVMPGHVEALSTSDITVDIEGISIIGLGMGDLKPTITFGDTTDEINVTADNVLLKNLRCVSGVNNLAHFIDNDAQYLHVEDCDFITSSALEAYAFINHATTKDYLWITRCRAEQPSDPEGTNGGAGTGFLYCIDSGYIFIKDCVVLGNFETAIIHNDTTKCFELVIDGCTFNQDLADGLHIVLEADSTGAMTNSNGRNINATDVTEAKILGTIGTMFWVDGNSFFGNDSGGGGQLQVAGSTATT